MATRRWVAVLVAAAVLAACGGDDGGGSGSGTGGTDGPEIGGSAVARGPIAWPAPPPDQVAALTEAAGLVLEPRETLLHHVHAHLDVFIDGEHRRVPAGIGIKIDDPGVREFDDLGSKSYGGAECDAPCISPLHTHDESGVLHTESATAEDNTLGQLFTEWGVELTDTCVGEHCTPETPIAVYVDGEEVPLAGAGDIALTDLKEIAIVIGEPPARIPSEGNFSAA